MKQKNPNQSFGILLDQFDHASIRDWSRISEDFDCYNVLLFYHLEGLRKLHNEELINSLAATSGVAHDAEDWCRIVDYKYSLQPLSSKGSAIAGGRFNIGANLDNAPIRPFPAFYLAEDYDTAFAEKFGTIKHRQSISVLSEHELALRNPSSFTSCNLRFKLNNLFDLTVSDNLKGFVKIIGHFSMTKDLKDLAKQLKLKAPYLIKEVSQLRRVLEENWRLYPVQHGIPSNSQIFGKLLRDSGFEGAIYNSTKNASKKCIAVFVENLDESESYISLADTPPPGVLHTTLNSETWKQLI